MKKQFLDGYWIEFVVLILCLLMFLFTIYMRVVKYQEIERRQREVEFQLKILQELKK